MLKVGQLYVNVILIELCNLVVYLVLRFLFYYLLPFMVNKDYQYMQDFARGRAVTHKLNSATRGHTIEMY